MNKLFQTYVFNTRRSINNLFVITADSISTLAYETPVSSVTPTAGKHSASSIPRPQSNNLLEQVNNLSCVFVYSELNARTIRISSKLKLYLSFKCFVQ